MRVQVVRAWPRRAERVDLALDEGASVGDAIVASGFDLADGIDGIAVFGERVGAAHRLQDGDRVELLRPLLVDPKQARRLRAGRTGR